MYFPFLRGRQNELLAIRELSENGRLSNRIVPLIEPVKLTSTLNMTVKEYLNAGRDLAIIINPEVGSFKEDLEREKGEKKAEEYKELVIDNKQILHIGILNHEFDSKSFIENYKDNLGIICNDIDEMDNYEKYFENQSVKYIIMPDESGFKRRIEGNRVILAERFNKKERNSDYIQKDDEFFSDAHLYYIEDGFVGFSDYSVVGKEYSETGFAPYAVVIHIVYFDANKKLRIKHFVSDTNDDSSNIPGKFKEALEKLILWNRDYKLNTLAMKGFTDLYNRKIYPGLGTIKKLSIMHHLELIGDYLDGSLF